MGSYRAQYSIKPATKVSGLNREGFYVEDRELYVLWQRYYELTLKDKLPPSEAMFYIMKLGVSQNVIVYLLALSLESVTAQYFREGVMTGGQ